MKTASLISTSTLCLVVMACSTSADPPAGVAGSSSSAGGDTSATGGGTVTPSGGSGNETSSMGGSPVDMGGTGTEVGGSNVGTTGGAPDGTAGTTPAMAGSVGTAGTPGTGGTVGTGGAPGTAGMGGAMTGGAGGPPTDLLSIVGAWDGALLQYPCDSSGKANFDCPQPSTSGCKSVSNGSPNASVIPPLGGVATSWTMGGTPGTVYDVTMHVQGLVEMSWYHNGTRAAGTASITTTPRNTFQSGGTALTFADNGNGFDYNQYELDVAPAAPGAAGVYFLNSVVPTENPHTSTKTQHLTFDVDYTVTIKVPAGAKVSVSARDSNCVEVQNCGNTQQSGQCASPRTVNLSGSVPAPPASFSRQGRHRNYERAIRPLRHHQGRGFAVKIPAWFAGLALVSLLGVTRGAHAEVTLAKPADNWEVYTLGRVGAFVEVVEGNGPPAPLIEGRAVSDDSFPFDSADPGASSKSGHLLASRVRSGFLGNILSFGVRNHLTLNTTVTAQISLWSNVETNGERTYLPNVTDAREGYLKVEGPGGSLLLGRAISLFGRGATETDFLYGHGYAVGSPAGFNVNGPSAGHIGFGVLANVFVAGVVYATPIFGGLQLSVGYYDPAELTGIIYARTKLGRPEAEATYDTTWGANNKLHVFVDGAFQKLYNNNGLNDSKNVYGAQAGARLELGAFHIGVSGFSGKGTGVSYFLNYTQSISNGDTGALRPIDGGYVQAQVVVKKFDFNVGAGITRAHQLTDDFSFKTDYLKNERGLSGVVVYHFTPYLHGALDYFRADINWWGGEKQGLNSFNAGMTATW